MRCSKYCPAFNPDNGERGFHMCNITIDFAIPRSRCAAQEEIQNRIEKYSGMIKWLKKVKKYLED